MTLALVSPNPLFDMGVEFAGGKLYTYETGTTTPKTTWTDSTKEEPNTNPIILDSKGRAHIWIDSSNGAYRFRLTDANDVVLYTKDDVKESGGGEFTYDDIFLDNTTNANQHGIIYKGEYPFIHDFSFGDNGVVTPNGWNIFIGEESGNLTMGSNATSIVQSSLNIGIGYQTLKGNTTGSENIGIGYQTLKGNTTGWNNIAIGSGALEKGEKASGNIAIGLGTLSGDLSYGTDYNIAIGRRALSSHISGYYSIAIGPDALRYNTTGAQNSAFGSDALRYNTTGEFNVAVGPRALETNTTGDYNVAVGPRALGSNNIGGFNVAIGVGTMFWKTSGDYNIAIGDNAGSYVDGGVNKVLNANTSIFIGSESKSHSSGRSNEIVIGHNAVGAGSNTVTIGNSSITKTVLRGDTSIHGKLTNYGKVTLSGETTIFDTLLAYGAITTYGAIKFRPGSSVNPSTNGDVVFEATNNTTITVKLKGSDGIVRTGTITLS